MGDAYSALAKHYDKLIEYDYKAVAEIAYSNSVGDYLDLFCGTGLFTIELAKLGLRVQGSDLSEEMLNVATVNARKQGLRICFRKENACSFAYSKPLDGITAICDGINYINDDGLDKLFKRVSEALKTGGIFLFDYSTEYKLKEILGNNLYYEDLEDITYFWQNSYDKKRGAVNLELLFFEKAPDGRYIRTEEIQRQYVHSRDMILNLAEKHGFSVIRESDLNTLGAPKKTSKSLLVLLRKE